MPSRALECRVQSLQPLLPLTAPTQGLPQARPLALLIPACHRSFIPKIHPQGTSQLSPSAACALTIDLIKTVFDTSLSSGGSSLFPSQPQDFSLQNSSKSVYSLCTFRLQGGVYSQHQAPEPSPCIGMLCTSSSGTPGKIGFATPSQITGPAILVPTLLPSPIRVASEESKTPITLARVRRFHLDPAETSLHLTSRALITLLIASLATNVINQP